MEFASKVVDKVTMDKIINVMNAQKTVSIVQPVSVLTVLNLLLCSMELATNIVWIHTFLTLLQELVNHVLIHARLAQDQLQTV